MTTYWLPFILSFCFLAVQCFIVTKLAHKNSRLLHCGSSGADEMVYRYVREIDNFENMIPDVTALIIDNLVGPFSWWQQAQRNYAFMDNQASLKERYSRVLGSNSKRNRKPPNLHEMIVVSYESDIVGFIELGLSPIPVVYEMQESKCGPNSKRVSDDITSAHTADDEKDSPDVQHLKSINFQADSVMYVPQIGNLVVSTAFRRRGIASKLMALSYDVSKQWGSDYVFCTVEPDNTNAINLYRQKLEFDVYLTLPPKYQSPIALMSPPKDNILLAKRIS